MNFNIDFSFNGISSLLILLAWCVIFFLAYRLYKKHGKNVKAWRVALIILLGLFSLDFDFNVAATMIKVPILPLGVWLLYLLSKNTAGQWERFRPYAWLGFFANLIFLAVTLISIPIHQLLYPTDAPSTYFANVENVSVLNIHPSAGEINISEERLQKQVRMMSEATVDGHQWYYDEPEHRQGGFIGRNERFPYLLQGIEPKWGSGLNTVIYLEQDGKGLLVTTAEGQLYLRSDESLIEGGK
ncbi:MAG: hypothetical protein AB2392_16125 [Neobacillus sp.]